MRQDVTVKFGDGDDDIALHTQQAMTAEEARAWLDAEYVRNECVPSRASGKVLIADKLLSIAIAVGPKAFEDRAWADSYARAAAGALGKAYISVDVANTTVGF